MSKLVLKFEGEGSELANQILAETRSHWPHHLILLLADTFNAMSDQPEFDDKAKRLKQYRDIFNVLWARDCSNMLEQCLEKLKRV